MKTHLKNYIKMILVDRPFLLLCIVTIIAGIIATLFAAFKIKPADIQIPVHYTAFGEVHFYKEKWFYLVGFALFPLFITVIHMALSLKLYALEKRQVALMLLWLTVVMLILAMIYTQSVFKIAYL